MNMYQFVYEEGTFWSLATDHEDAAWKAHQHAVNCGWTHTDVIPNAKKETLFS